MTLHPCIAGPFIDLHMAARTALCENLKTKEERSLSAFKRKFLDVVWKGETVAFLCAYGGIPAKADPSGSISFASIPASELPSLMRTSLGLGSVLTKGNPRGRELDEFGTMALQTGELWFGSAIQLSMLIVGPRSVREAFAFDRRLLLSVPDGLKGDEDLPAVLFMATAGLKEWLKVVAHKDDRGFPKEVRAAFRKCDEVIETIFKIREENEKALFVESDCGCNND